MRIRIGFPLVSNKEMYPVWVYTTNASGKGRAEWNGDALHGEYPFDIHQDLNLSVARILTKRNINFDCKDCKEVSPDQDGSVKIDGDSYGLLMHLAEYFELPYVDDPDLSILISGRLEIGSGFRPKPLNDKETLRIKGKGAQDKRYALLLVEDDYRQLDDSSGMMYAARMREVSRVPTSLEKIGQWIKDEGMGRAYILPINSMGEWEPTGKQWWEGLAAFLNLPEVGNASTGPMRRHSPIAHEARVEVKPGPVLLTANEGHIGDLFAAALPWRKDFLEKFLEHNSELCGQRLFGDGIGAKALANKYKLFFHTSDGRTPPSEPDTHVLVGGPAGCGKTFLAEAAILNVAAETELKVIYIAPTRSLAQEAYQTMCSRFGFEGSEFKPDAGIILSTGETSNNDWRLNTNDYKIAVLVNEKANLFLRPSKDFLGKLSLIVIDELHMLADPNRGGVLDMLIAKVHQENSKRRYDEGFLRMIGITTEDISKNEAIKEAFRVKDISGKVREPLSLTAYMREIEVEHAAQVYSAQSSTVDAIPILKFKDQRHLSLDAEVRHQKSREISALVKNLENNNSWGKASVRDGNVSTTLAEMIEDYSKRFRTLLIAHPSIAGLTDIALQLKNLRRDHARPAADEELQRLVTDNVVGRSTGENLIELSTYGIYLHHSELPRAIREEVEQHFRKPRPREDGIAEVLFATETLFYGVNLSTECVILTTPLWTRELPGETDLQYIQLTANEFHNIMGRAGRPGMWDRTRPIAVLCFPSREYNSNPGRIYAALDEYYGSENNRRRVISSLINDSDVLANNEGSLQSLDDVSYPTFRSVMDALRHRSGDEKLAPAEAVIALMKRTVFFHSGRCTEPDIESLVRKVLRVALKEDLIAIEGDRYKTMPEAEALIDTGTKWQSVSPMTIWIKSIKDMAGELGQSNLPVELLVPAFVSSQDLWHTAKTFCWEFNERIPIPSLRDQSEEQIKRALLKELKLLGMRENHRAEVEKRLSSLVDNISSSLPLKASASAYRKAIFYRLVVAFLRWLRGEDIEQIDVLSLKALNMEEPDANLLHSRMKGGEKRHFKERYTDRASWLAIMCLRFFEKKAEHLLPEHIRQLPRLSQRLRQGVPAQGLPLIAESRAKLTRWEVKKLLTNGVGPIELLRSQNPQELLRKAGVLSQERESEAGRIIDDVFSFYFNQINELGRLVKDKDTDQPWNRFLNLINQQFDSRPRGQAIRLPAGQDKRALVDALYDMLKVQDKPDVPRENKIEVSKLSDDLSLLLSDPENETLVLRVADFEEDEVNDDRKSEIVVRFPWPHGKQTKRLELTACGAMILASLIARKFLKPSTAIQDLREWAQASEGVKAIKDILKFEMNEIPFELREIMLRFNEPGIDEAS